MEAALGHGPEISGSQLFCSWSPGVDCFLGGYPVIFTGVEEFVDETVSAFLSLFRSLVYMDGLDEVHGLDGYILEW
jgi:hypothetical protein